MRDHSAPPQSNLSLSNARCPATYASMHKSSPPHLPEAQHRRVSVCTHTMWLLVVLPAHRTFLLTTSLGLSVAKQLTPSSTVAAGTA